MSDDVLIGREGGLGRIRLNRPEAIHALNLGMVRAVNAALAAWRDDPSIVAIAIDHAEGRGFCAGGDIRMLSQSGTADGAEARAFFRDEYRMNAALFGYAKPSVAFMDGITMGGGVGISQPCRFRIATENTRFAMPESGIGLFPDVGGGWYLSRLPGRMGQHLALTGARIDGADCAALGLATHYISSERLETVKGEIAENPARIDAILDASAETPPPSAYLAHRAEIDRLFAPDRLEDIIAALAADPSDWAQAQLAILRTKSPTTCKVALRQLREARAMPSFADEMAQEYAIACRVVTGADFAEGVRAVIVDKDNAPRWNPATPEGVTDAIIDAIFAPLAPDKAWTPHD